MNCNKYNVNKFKHLKLNVSIICIINKSWAKYLNGCFGQDQFQGIFGVDQMAQWIFWTEANIRDILVK